jgi:hypothetical protein
LVLEEGSGELSEEEKTQFFASVEGERSYHVDKDNSLAGRGECDPGFIVGGDVQISIDHDPSHNKVTILNADGTPRSYEKTRDNDFMFCRDDNFGETHTIECIEFKTPRKFEIAIIKEVDDDYEACFLASYTHGSDTTAGDLVDGAIFENCIVRKDEGFYWENTGHTVEEGDGVTSCTWTFTVQNDSNQDQILIYHQTSYRGSDTTKWEGWKTRSLVVNEPFQERYSFVDYYGRGEDVTWIYSTKMLVVQDKLQCFSMTTHTDENIALWEQHAIQLENPCIK